MSLIDVIMVAFVCNPYTLSFVQLGRYRLFRRPICI